MKYINRLCTFFVAFLVMLSVMFGFAYIAGRDLIIFGAGFVLGIAVFKLILDTGEKIEIWLESKKNKWSE